MLFFHRNSEDRNRYWNWYHFQQLGGKHSRGGILEILWGILSLYIYIVVFIPFSSKHWWLREELRNGNCARERKIEVHRMRERVELIEADWGPRNEDRRVGSEAQTTPDWLEDQLADWLGWDGHRLETRVSSSRRAVERTHDTQVSWFLRVCGMSAMNAACRRIRDIQSLISPKKPEDSVLGRHFSAFGFFAIPGHDFI